MNLSHFEDQPNGVIIKDNRMYAHKLAQFYYTTYDIQHSEDVVNPQTSHCDVMLLGPQAERTSKETSPHPFLYACVLGIYHVNVIYTGPGMVKFDFLWVCWFNISLDAIYSVKQLSGRHLARLV
jgi:hypothetical protein